MSDLIENLEREHSGIVGGSTAGRMLNCPGHYRIVKAMQEQIDVASEELKVKALDTYELNSPALAAALQNAEELRVSLNKSSSYADEGTKLHRVMEYLVDNEIDRNAVLGDATVDRMFDELEIDDARMFDAVIPAYNMFNDFLDAILAEDGDEYMLKIETRVTFPGIDDAFGTCDVLIRTSKRTVVWDWKFGAGVPVAASYKVTHEKEYGRLDDPSIEKTEVEYGNDQLMFYARAALATHPDYFVDNFQNVVLRTRPIELVICQPRVSDEIGRYTTNISELLDFEADLIDAVQEAMEGENPTLKIGKWCDFAPCKTQCPLHLNGPVAAEEIAQKLGKLRLQASQTPGARPTAELAKRDVEEIEASKQSYAEALSTMLQLAEIAEPYFAEAHKQAHAFMEAGGVVPGYKLVPKRAGWDSWADPTKAEQFLARAGLPLEERRKPMEPITPAVARTKLKALKGGDPKTLKLLEKYVKQGVSSGTNIAREDNPKEAVKPLAASVADLAGKLKQIGAK